METDQSSRNHVVMHIQMYKILFFTHELIFWVYKIIKYERETLKLNVYFLTKIRSSVLACVFTQNTHASKHSQCLARLKYSQLSENMHSKIMRTSQGYNEAKAKVGKTLGFVCFW